MRQEDHSCACTVTCIIANQLRFMHFQMYINYVFGTKLHRMANQVIVNINTSKGTWETTFQKSTRIKDVILGSRMHFRFPKEAKLVLCRQDLPHANFDPDRALVNYNVIDGDILILKEA